MVNVQLTAIQIANNGYRKRIIQKIYQDKNIKKFALLVLKYIQYWSLKSSLFKKK